jgi:hypothetical protein
VEVKSLVHFPQIDYTNPRSLGVLLEENNPLSSMKSNRPQTPEAPPSPRRLLWILALGCLLLATLFLLRPHPRQDTNAAAAGNPTAPMTITHSGRGLTFRSRLDSDSTPVRPAEEIVAEKVSQFARGRQELVEAMAKQFNVPVPEEVNRFFAAAQAGRWEETTNLFAALKKLRMSNERPPGLEKLWPAIMETYGVAEQAHDWPAQQLLDYGNTVLDSLRPGMVYVGGTDAGRFIPTLLTDTAESEPHIVLTQNALADGTYLEYLKFRYGERLNPLTAADSQNAFSTYVADAQKRLQHDQQFPNESKQVRPGEDIRVSDNRVQVSGQVAVMAINEQLLQALLQKNPDRSFALEESFPLKSLYAGATTLGPITELHASDPATALTPERAAQSLDYWRDTIQTLLANSDAATATAPRDAYAKLILGQANLFLDRNLPGQAEQALQLANQLSPAQSDTVTAYARLLIGQQRTADARQILETAVNLAPDNKSFRDLLGLVNQMK